MVAVNHGNKSLFLLEFERTSDLDPRYCEEALDRAERQYVDEVEGIRQVLPRDWKVTQVSIIAGSTSVNEAAWNAAMKALGIPAKRWKIEDNFRIKPTHNPNRPGPKLCLNVASINH